MLLVIEAHHERVRHYQRDRHEITTRYALQDQKVGLLIYPDEFRLRLASSHKRVCLVDQTLNSEMGIVNLDHLDPLRRIRRGLIVVQAILLAMPRTALKIHLTNPTTGCLDQPNVLACWIGTNDLLVGNMSQEQDMKREGITSVSLGQNVNHDPSETLVMRETTPGQGENIQDLKGQKDLRGLIETTAGLHLIMQIVQNVPRGHQEETRHNRRAGEMLLRPAGMRLQLRRLQVSILNEQHSFKVQTSLVPECQFVGKLKKEIVLHDQPLQDAKRIVNTLQGLREKIDRKGSPNRKVEMHLQRQ